MIAMAGFHRHVPAVDGESYMISTEDFCNFSELRHRCAEGHGNGIGMVQV